MQEQLGHASIELTVGTYGRWLRKRAPGAVDRLDQALVEMSDKAVAAGEAGGLKTLLATTRPTDLVAVWWQTPLPGLREPDDVPASC